uniref:F5/8 type C domain-containing protein n=1 Tax=Guillardia theta TaxID=55529 RepID=A0A7S4JEL9_GUITH|mmetsp:Transcript_15735/g.52668  ORF Transcript_15735/g.52668 Transcript_15735/m.52668 type:complete len:629 (+) Transcript_15735:175-2061(+)
MSYQMPPLRSFLLLQLISATVAEIHGSASLHVALSNSRLPQHSRQNLPMYLADARRGNKAHVLQESGPLGSNLELISTALYNAKQGVVDMSRKVKETADAFGSFAVEKTQLSIDRAAELYKQHPKEAAAASLSLVVATALLHALCPHKKEEEAVKAQAFSLQDALNQTSRMIQECTTTVCKLLSDAAAVMGNRTEAALNTTQEWYESKVKVGAQETLDLLQALWAAASETGGEAAQTILRESKNLTSTGVQLSKNVSKLISASLQQCKSATARHVEEIKRGSQVYSIPHTIKSGRLSSKRVVLDLGEERRIGGLLISNKASSYKDKQQVKAGTRDFQVLVSNDGKKWRVAHKGWLKPGLPFCSSQLVSFKSQLCRYVKIVSLKQYRGGAGFDSLKVLPVFGMLTSWLYATRPVDFTQSVLDSKYPEIWGEVELPVEEWEHNVTRFIERRRKELENVSVATLLTIQNTTTTALKSSKSISQKVIDKSKLIAKNVTRDIKFIANSTVALANSTASQVKASLVKAKMAAGEMRKKVASYMPSKLSISKLFSTYSFNFTSMSDKLSRQENKLASVCLPVAAVALGGLAAYQTLPEFKARVDPILVDLKLKAEEPKEEKKFFFWNTDTDKNQK